MSGFTRFMKANKSVSENVIYVATQSLTDEKGEALEWEFRKLTSKEYNNIESDCLKEVPIKGRPNQFREKIDMVKWVNKLICASVVTPNLNDKELQDSYGVMSAEELIRELVDDPGEYTELSYFVQNLNGFIKEGMVEKAKN